MGKSSNSRRRNRSKTSSKKSRNRSKSRRHKSKKLRRRDDSLSYFDDDLGSSLSVTSSGSEDDKRSRKARLLTRRDKKGNKKRARRRSSSHHSSEGSPRIKKRKRSNRDANDEMRKKTYRKKKPRRDVSVSSGSTGSLSCSTCPGGSSRSEDSDFETPKGRSRKKDNDKRNLGSAKSGSKRSRYRSVNCSSHSRRSEGSDCQINEEETIIENNHPKRLRSVIIVTGRQDEGEELSKDECREDITYDRYDNLSFRSNESNVEESKGEENCHLSFSSKEMIVENEREVVSSLKNSEGGITEFDENDMKDIVGKRNSESPGNGGIDNVDLESILRQKALENLKRFKVGIQRNGKTADSVNVESVLVKSPRDRAREVGTCKELTRAAVANMACSKSLKEEDTMYVGSMEAVKGTNAPSIRRDSTFSMEKVQKADTNLSLGQLAVAGETDERKASTVLISAIDKINLSSVNENASESSPSITPRIDDNGHETSNGNKHCSTAPEPSSHKPQHEAKESSQFEQKTMSVMRGGEMVQVNYKVYIPKKVPALARRQLKR